MKAATSFENTGIYLAKLHGITFKKIIIQNYYDMGEMKYLYRHAS